MLYFSFKDFITPESFNVTSINCTLLKSCPTPSLPPPPTVCLRGTLFLPFMLLRKCASMFPRSCLVSILPAQFSLFCLFVCLFVSLFSLIHSYPSVLLNDVLSSPLSLFCTRGEVTSVNLVDPCVSPPNHRHYHHHQVSNSTVHHHCFILRPLWPQLATRGTWFSPPHNDGRLAPNTARWG